jgi:hypothetical protein
MPTEQIPVAALASTPIKGLRLTARPFGDAVELVND